MDCEICMFEISRNFRSIIRYDLIERMVGVQRIVGKWVHADLQTN